MRPKKLIALLTAALIFLMPAASLAGEPNEAPDLPVDAPAVTEGISGWAPDSPALEQILLFVDEVTDPDAQTYLPPEDRIAVFDFDGTLFGELFPTYFDNCLFMHRALHDEDYEAPADIKEYAQALEESFLNHTPEPESPRSTAQMTAELFAGMTVEEYRDYVRDFMAVPAYGFENMTYGEGFYVPMTELVRYLAEQEFKVFVSSGSERSMVRELMAGTLDAWVPSERVIGSTFSLTATGQGETSGRNYTYTPEDAVLLEGNLTIKNQKANKVFSIVDEIGKSPVLVFGNSSGDLAMAEYCVQHKGRAFMLLCDDLDRDYGNLEVAEKFRASCEKSGFWTISMKNEFEKIYAEGVQKVEGANAPAGRPEISAAQNAASAQEIMDRGVLYVGTTGDYKPMSYLEPDTQEYWGFDIAIAEDLAKALGVELVFVETSWPTLMEDTLAGKFDLAISGITVTDARKEQALMSDGYFGNGKTVLCRAEDADRYLSLDAINHPEVRVMENPGGLNEKFARENLPDATIIIHDVNQEIPGLVAEGEADVMITEIMEAGYYVSRDSRLAAPLIYEPFTHGELGVLMPKGAEDLLAYVNTFIAGEKESGRIEELADLYIYRNMEEDLDAAA